jgi:sulfopyruvate decarboxylase TPP-binding subunit
MHEALGASSTISVVQVCREGEALALCSGVHVGGGRGALLIENQGLFDSGNVLKWAVGMRMPFVMLVGYLFYERMERDADGALRTIQGTRDVTEPFLEAFQIPYEIVARDEDVHLVGHACRRAWETSQPTAVLLSSADAYQPGT